MKRIILASSLTVAALRALVARAVRLSLSLAVAVAAATIAIPGSAWKHGFATNYGSLTVHASHLDLVTTAPTPSTSSTITQEGFYYSGDGGAASYDWNASSYCPGGTRGSPTAADGLICVLPSSQHASAAGRYLLRTAAGAIDARILGFKDDGTDNSSLVPRLNAVLGTTGTHVVFSSSSVNAKANYWFSQPLDIVSDGGVSCGDGSRAASRPTVNLVFTPGIDGVRFLESEVATMQGYATGVSYGDLRGCGVISTGYSVDYTPTVAGNTTATISRMATPQQIARGAKQTEPLWAIGDSIVMFPLNTPYWTLSGSIKGNVLTVSSTPRGSQSTTDPGITVGQMLQGTGLPHGIFIAATHTENPTYTGAGGTGTYLLNYSIANPPIAAEAIAGGTLSTNFQTEVESGSPLVVPGTTIVSCSTPSNNQCPLSGTMTLSNAPTLGVNTALYMLPGPYSAKGSQMYNVTTSLTGHTSSAVTAGISNGSRGSGMILNVTAGPGNLNLGQVVIGTSGGNVSTTITSPLTIGEYSSILVSSCTGVVRGAYVVGFDGGNPVFPSGTTVNACTGGNLSINVASTSSQTTSGSPVVQIRAYYAGLTALWAGEPITGTNIPANTTVQGWAFVPYDNSYINVTLNHNATGTTFQDGGKVYLGGAVDAAPSSTSLTFLQGSATISALGTGTGGNGTYILDASASLAPGAALYAYDTPGTVYLTAGPRNVMPQDLIWTDAFPFGAVAAKIYGTSASKETIIVAPSSPYGQLSASVAHPGGSGKMWVLPSGIMRNISGSSSGNMVVNFGVGINMACAQNEYPETGCGQSKDSENVYVYNMVGRYTAGNNSGGSASTFNEYDHNYVADIAELGTVGSTYLGEMMQGADESSNTHVVIANCGTNGSPFISVYASGSEWESICTPQNVAMLSAQTMIGQGGGPWMGTLWDVPYGPTYTTNSYRPQTNCSGAPTSKFKVESGVVTHC